MSWIVILDNGSPYDDHQQEMVASCPDNPTAQKLRDILEKWLKDRPRDPDDAEDLDPDWVWNYQTQELRHPWPFSKNGMVPGAAKKDDSCIKIQFVENWLG